MRRLAPLVLLAALSTACTAPAPAYFDNTGRDDVLGHSWGGILAIEYALKYQQHLKGPVVSNMMASIPAYNEYARTVLMPAMDQGVIQFLKDVDQGRM